MSYWNLPDAEKTTSRYNDYDVDRMMREFERLAQIQRDRREALEFLLYLARRDHRHLVIDRSPGHYDAWVSVEARADEQVKVYVFDSGSIPTFHYNGANPWNSTSSTGL